MATKAQPVRIGPFSGGINTYSDPTAIADEDAVDLINFDVDLDGSLISRPPFVSSATSGGREGIRILGIYIATDGTSYVIFSTTTHGTCYYNIVTDTFGTVTSSMAATAMVQYMNKAWLISAPGAANPGGSWDGTTFTAVAAIPRGTTATVYKERIFVGTGALDVTNPSRLFFSGPANPTSWTGTDFLDVNNGDGQDIVKVYGFSGSVVVFKTNSTYVYAYESSPTKGQTQSISATIGLDGPDCMAESENTLYVLSNSEAYSISNWNWEQLNVKAPFEHVNAHTGFTHSNYSVSAVGNRIVFRYFDTYYVFGTKTRAWTRWLSTRTPDMFIKSPIKPLGSSVETFFAGNYLSDAAPSGNNTLFTFQEAHAPTRTETFTCTLRTKVYSMNVPYSFKRLMWWGVDLLSKSAITVQVTPVTYGKPVRWSDLTGLTWADLAGRTWGAPLDISIDVTDAADIKNPTSVRMFVKFIKSLRFRQIQYTLSSEVDGSTATGPLRIYSITAFIVNKETVSKKIS